MIDKSNERVQRMFGEIAPRYDFLNHLLSLGIDHYWRWQAVRSAPLDCDAPLLDLCTGTADFALAFARRTADNVRIVAADFCHPMLVIGRRKAEELCKSNRLTLIEADAQSLPFPDNTFQLVSVAFGLRNISDTNQGLREMVRVMLPGGRLVVLEFSLPQRQPLRSLYGWYFGKVLPRIGQALARNRSSAYNYLPASVGEFPSGEALMSRMRDAGLSHVESRSLTLGTVTLYIGIK